MFEGDDTFGAKASSGPDVRFKLPWREAGPPNHHDDKVDSDQQVVNKELSLQVFEGDDTFGAKASFGPDVRFGPRSSFAGGNSFGRADSFGALTHFDVRSKGTDSFAGEHRFGTGVDWGAHNAPQPNADLSPASARAPADAAPPSSSSSATEPLPPGYSETGVAGVYEYTAPAARQSVRKEGASWEWKHPTGVPDSYAAAVGQQVASPSVAERQQVASPSTAAAVPPQTLRATPPQVPACIQPAYLRILVYLVIYDSG